jgi:hypothetical protein
MPRKTPQEIAFTLHGVPFDLLQSLSTKDRAHQIRTSLDALPIGVLIDSTEMADMAKIELAQTRYYLTPLVQSGHAVKLKRQYYFGSAASINALKEGLPKLRG